ncbi:coiled-coil domain-containing protein [Tautonia sociabilis]|uniref:Uncharacterized protein n=1 Tax=Tautonia sociabilis TaxID=2080755 RepID=A0A432MKT1_9BACT|nr:hypothetical protein [Tautonia sociabilis]RUL87869.1 hypothetical protein TsocGM_10070 [Tautonia sociabilis]
MSTANDSQGLKIAVAIFVSLTVILAVTSYFLYSEYSKASEQLEAARNEASQANQKAQQANANLLSLRDRAGYSNLSDPSAIEQQIKQDQDALVEKLNTELGAAVQAIGRAQQEGATGPEVARFRQNIDTLLQSFRDESTQNPTFKGSLATLASLTANQASLASALATDNVRLRRQLENVNNVNQAELNTQQQAAQQAQDDLASEHRKYETLFDQQRQTIDNLTTQVATLRAENDQLAQRLANQQNAYEAERERLLTQINDWRTRAEKEEGVLDVADGYVTFVDYSTRRIRLNITRSQGARPQMILSVFDADAPGLPTDKPKARIKLLQVNERDSVASIEEEFDKTNPIRAGDQVYSAAWSPTEPQRFALIGKIDMNRDGVDDRDDLIRLIEAAGGVIDYDLPPPGSGQERGELNAGISYYVIDERQPIRTPSNARSVREMSLAEQAFAETKTEVLDRARSLGIRPLPVERLLSSLGYSFGMLIPGEPEATNDRALRNLLNPGGMSAPPPGTEEFERNRQEAGRAAPF